MVANSADITRTPEPWNANSAEITLENVTVPCYHRLKTIIYLVVLLLMMTMTSISILLFRIIRGMPSVEDAVVADQLYLGIENYSTLRACMGSICLPPLLLSVILVVLNRHLSFIILWWPRCIALEPCHIAYGCFE